MKMAVRRLQFGVAVIKDKLILVGGRDGLRTLNTVCNFWVDFQSGCIITIYTRFNFTGRLY